MLTDDRCSVSGLPHSYSTSCLAMGICVCESSNVPFPSANWNTFRVEEFIIPHSKGNQSTAMGQFLFIYFPRLYYKIPYMSYLVSLSLKFPYYVISSLASLCCIMSGECEHDKLVLLGGCFK